MHFDVLTLFPEIFSGYTTQSILNKAIEKQLVGIKTHNMRDWTEGAHNKIDDRPYGGGPGMILMVEPVVKCVREISRTPAAPSDQPPRTILLTPTGRKLDQMLVEELSQQQRFILLCGRYEGLTNESVIFWIRWKFPLVTSFSMAEKSPRWCS